NAEDHRQPSGVQPDQSGAGGAVQGGGEDGTDEQQPDQHLAVDGQGVGGGGDRDYPYRDSQYRRRCDGLATGVPMSESDQRARKLSQGPAERSMAPADPCRPP